MGSNLVWIAYKAYVAAYDTAYGYVYDAPLMTTALIMVLLPLITVAEITLAMHVVPHMTMTMTMFMNMITMRTTLLMTMALIMLLLPLMTCSNVMLMMHMVLHKTFFSK